MRSHGLREEARWAARLGGLLDAWLLSRLPPDAAGRNSNAGTKPALPEQDRRGDYC